MGQSFVPMKPTLHRIAAFCDGPFQGNPAGVCLDSAGVDESAMQALAARVGYSETAYPVKTKAGWSLRWFTPATEVNLCGHATLATAWLLWRGGHVNDDESIHFETKSGVLETRLSGDWIEMNFPAAPFKAKPLPKAIGFLGDRVVACGTYGEDWLIEMASQDDVLAMDVDAPWLAEIEARGLAFTAKSKKEEFDVVTRFFAPRAGIPEDPATGSAHCGLGPYWSQKLGKDTLHCWQASSRGGVLRVTPQGDRVLLAGKAREFSNSETIDWTELK